MIDASVSISDLPAKRKRGDTRDDGKVFWCYDKSIKSGELWVSEKKYHSKVQAHRKAMERYRDPIKNREAVRKWRLENPQKARDSSRSSYLKYRDVRLDDNRKWREKNRERHRASSIRWQRENWDRVLEKNRRWSKANPDKVLANVNRRRTIKLKQTPCLSVE